MKQKLPSRSDLVEGYFTLGLIGVAVTYSAYSLLRLANDWRRELFSKEK